MARTSHKLSDVMNLIQDNNIKNTILKVMSQKVTPTNRAFSSINFPQRRVNSLKTTPVMPKNGIINSFFNDTSESQAPDAVIIESEEPANPAVDQVIM